MKRSCSLLQLSQLSKMLKTSRCLSSSSYIISAIDICSMRQEIVHNFQVTFITSKMKRSSSFLQLTQLSKMLKTSRRLSSSSYIISAIDICSVGQEKPHHFQVTMTRRILERSVPILSQAMSIINSILQFYSRYYIILCVQAADVIASAPQ